MLFFNEIESYIVGMFCHIIFVQIAISDYFVGFFFFFCIVWYVRATSSLMFIPNEENVIETPCGIKGPILPDFSNCTASMNVDRISKSAS